MIFPRIARLSVSNFFSETCSIHRNTFLSESIHDRAQWFRNFIALNSTLNNKIQSAHLGIDIDWIYSVSTFWCYVMTCLAIHLVNEQKTKMYSFSVWAHLVSLMLAFNKWLNAELKTKIVYSNGRQLKAQSTWRIIKWIIDKWLNQTKWK